MTKSSMENFYRFGLVFRRTFLLNNMFKNMGNHNLKDKGRLASTNIRIYVRRNCTELRNTPDCVIDKSLATMLRSYWLISTLGPDVRKF